MSTDLVWEDSVIWEYEPAIVPKEHLRAALTTAQCLFCGTPLTLMRHETHTEYVGHGPQSESVSVRACECCGWWTKQVRARYVGYGDEEILLQGAMGVLRNLNPADDDAPIEEVRAYLLARYEARLEMSPRLFEQTVASVYCKAGRRAVVTGRSGDGGIDVVLEDATGKQTGVQVKRTKNSIKVEAIRSLAGALLLRGMPEGIFVTTSRFQSGCTEEARIAGLRGKRIQLVDAVRFYDALRIGQREAYSSSDDPSAPFSGAGMVTLEREQRERPGRIWHY